jgi:hypothetical protein
VANFRQRPGLHIAELQFMSNLLLNQHFITLLPDSQRQSISCVVSAVG